MTLAARAYPVADEGFYHLTTTGWQRKDHRPFPAGRIETWRFESEKPANEVKEQVHLTRLWASTDLTPQQRDLFRVRFGYPVRAARGVHLIIDCRN